MSRLLSRRNLLKTREHALLRKDKDTEPSSSCVRPLMIAKNLHTRTRMPPAISNGEIHTGTTAPTSRHNSSGLRLRQECRS